MISFNIARCGKRVLGIVWVTFIVVFVIGSFWGGVGCDSATLLVEMERISEGYMPYSTLHLNYPPLWFYINSGLKWLLHVPYGCYRFYLMVHWLFVCGCAWCIYYISCKWGATKNIALLVVGLFYLVIFWVDGNGVLFEIPSVFWGLMAICFYLKWKSNHHAWQILVGILACCSFLTKQFGAGFFLLVLWLMVTAEFSNKWRQIGCYIIGYSIPLLFCYLFWGVDFFQSILFNGYGSDLMDVYWGRDISITSKIFRMGKNLFYFIYRIEPIVCISVLFLPIIFIQEKWREGLLCIFGLGGFLLQFFYVHEGYHYFLYMIPFGLLLIPLMLSLNTNFHIKYLIIFAIGLTILSSVYSDCRIIWKRYKYVSNFHESIYTRQVRFGKQLTGMLKEGETIFIPHVALCNIYYTANLYPPCISEIGYGVGPMELNIQSATKCVTNADYVLHFSEEKLNKLYPDGKQFEYYFTDSLKTYINQFPCDTMGKEIVLHYMNRSPIVSIQE